MSFFKNKHVITAMIVAPLLSVGTYFMVDVLVREQPQAAVAGASYRLVAASNCRYSSGRCDLSNAQFKSFMVVSDQQGRGLLTLTSDYRLQSATVGFVTSDGVETSPLAMRANDAEHKSWAVEFEVPANADTQLRIAMRAQDTHYYAETSMAFSDYQTAFDKDFRQ